MSVSKCTSSDALIQWRQDQMAGVKLAGHIVFGELRKTATGKVQKFILRQPPPEAPDELRRPG